MADKTIRGKLDLGVLDASTYTDKFVKPKDKKSGSGQNRNALASAIWTAGTSLLQGLTENRMNAAASRASAASLRANARLAIMQANTQNQYLNEQLANQVWGTHDKRDKFLSTQNVAMAASGFDVSAGDMRLTADTIRQTDNVVSGMNRSAYLQAFETNRAAMMEANRLEYAAKSADITAKYSSGWRGFMSASNQSFMSGLGAYFNARYANLAQGQNVKPV